MGLRRRSWTPFFGKPSGLSGRVGARMMVSMKGKYYRSMAAKLDLQADDELLDVGCGSGRLFVAAVGGRSLQRHHLPRRHEVRVRPIHGPGGDAPRRATRWPGDHHHERRQSGVVRIGPLGYAERLGIWCWSDADAARLVEEAGFTDVSISVLPVPSKSQLIRAVKPASTAVASAPERADPVKASVA